MTQRNSNARKIVLALRRENQLGRRGRPIGISYRPPTNQPREVARRLRQIAAGQLKVS